MGEMQYFPSDVVYTRSFHNPLLSYYTNRASVLGDGLRCADCVPVHRGVGAVPAVHALVRWIYAGQLEKLDMVHHGVVEMIAAYC